MDEQSVLCGEDGKWLLEQLLKRYKITHCLFTFLLAVISRQNINCLLSEDDIDEIKKYTNIPDDGKNPPDDMKDYNTIALR